MNQGKGLTGGASCGRMLMSSSRPTTQFANRRALAPWLLDTTTRVRGGVALGKESR